MRKNHFDFTEGKIFTPLLQFTIPILLALILQTMYGAVDLMVIGQFCSPSDVSAVSTGSQILHLVTVVLAGLSVGTTILIGQRLGEGDKEGTSKAVGTSIMIFLSLAAVTTVLTVPLAPVLASLLNTPFQAVSATTAYVRICGGGVICIVAYNLLGSVFRGIGDSRTPLIAVAIACVFNIIMDLFFVAVVGLGVSGVALATVLAQTISVIVSLLLVRKRGFPFQFGRSYLHFHRETVRKLVKLGTPIALQELLVTISFLVVLAIVNSLGVIASAGMGVAERLCGFILLLPSAFSQAVSTVVAQNYGAKKLDRARTALKCAILSAFSMGLILAYFGYFHGTKMATVFSSDPEVCYAGGDYLKAYAIDTLLTSFMFCFIGYFNGCGETTFVMIQGIIGAFFVRIPFSYFMSLTPNPTLFRIGLATPASTFVQIILCVFWFLKVKKKQENLMIQ